jgi:pimeloyl-ACP methyl ester carboxylesterase
MLDLSARIARLDMEAEKHGPPEGLKGFWRLWGSGGPLLLLHGGSGSWLHWAPVIDGLARTRRLLVADMPGFGSVRDEIPASFDELCEGLHGDLDRLADAAHGLDIAAFSFGATVGAELACRLGPRVRKLAFVGPAGLGGRRRRLVKLPRLVGLEGGALLEASRAHLLGLMISNPENATEEAVRAHAWNLVPRSFRTQEISRSEKVYELLPKLTCPATFLWGEEDPTLAQSLEACKARILALKPDAQIVTFPGAGHWLMQEEPAGVIDHVGS